MPEKCGISTARLLCRHQEFPSVLRPEPLQWHFLLEAIRPAIIEVSHTVAGSREEAIYCQGICRRWHVALETCRGRLSVLYEVSPGASDSPVIEWM